MKVGIIQPNYMPWRGYFDFIHNVDFFIFYDDVRYTRRDLRNRNKIKTSKGVEWLTVPVNDEFGKKLICNTEIDYSQSWTKKHLKKIHHSYVKSNYYL